MTTDNWQEKLCHKYGITSDIPEYDLFIELMTESYTYGRSVELKAILEHIQSGKIISESNLIRNIEYCSEMSEKSAPQRLNFFQDHKQ